MRLNNQTHAFTLVELLVSVALVAVLTLLSVAVSGAIRIRSKEVSCLGNLRTLSMALLNLANDNRGIIRTKTGGSGNAWALWTAQLYDNKYVDSKERLVCPSWPRAVDFDNVNWKWYTYGLNLFDSRATVYGISQDPDYQYYWNIRAVDNPSTCTLVMDSCFSVAGSEKGSQTFRVWSQKASTSDKSAVHLRHQGAALIAFLDGHTARVGPKELKALGFSAYYDQEGTLINRF